VRKHAGSVPTSIVIRRSPSRVELVVRNERGKHAVAAANGGGVGLVGMRERMRVYGGTHDAGEDEEGFAVRASLPVKDSAT